MQISTDAWVLYPHTANEPARAELRRESFTFDAPGDWEILAEPLFGCWEGNMAHALERQPIDVCKARGEERVVIGNAGVVRVLQTGANVTTVKVGDIGVIFCNGKWDKFGYPEKILGYDAPGTMGCLAKQMKLHERQVIPVPKDTQYSLPQWAAFSLRYITAWSNWQMAYGTWRLQMTAEDCPAPHVWGWGGGVSMAELALAKFNGCRVAMMSSSADRLAEMKAMGILAIDRRRFPHLSYDAVAYKNDAAYRGKYLESEKIFLDIVKEHTDGLGVSIFCDYVGAPVIRATLKALARQGIVTTAGWKEGMSISSLRAIECIDRHQHIHTHYARYPQGRSAVRFAENTGWMPHTNGKTYAFDEIPQLAKDYDDGKTNWYPIFKVND